jgi:serine/tyrosine/threonine adenylyltransferase
MSKLSSLFSSKFSEALPEFVSSVQPHRVRNPRLLSWNHDLAQELDLNPSPEMIELLAGNDSGLSPVATVYGGHQFGHWAGRLGDGRAMLLGERRGQEIQLKGAGPTPYSRRGDGFAVLRSSLREYLCSEAMHHLGVPSTRALALLTTGESVLRDMFYDGNPELEPGAICVRVAPSFLRFGHFEWPASQGLVEPLRKLSEHCRSSYYPDCATIEEMFAQICERTATMIVAWTRVGFVHGVMNTDNMSILGVTIDYGPYGWMDHFDPDWTPNTTDREHRRYRFGHQPAIAEWNLIRLQEALSTLNLDLKGIVDASYRQRLLSEWQVMMKRKLGLPTFDGDLVVEWDTLMRRHDTDMTLMFRELISRAQDEHDLSMDVFYGTPAKEHLEGWRHWLVKWRQAVRSGDLQASVRDMEASNPVFVLRNYLAQEAIDELQTKNDVSKLRRLEAALKQPYQVIDPELCGKRPDWALQRAGCSMLSCSS